MSAAKHKSARERDQLRAEADTLRQALVELQEEADVRLAEKAALSALVREAEEKVAVLQGQAHAAEARAGETAATVHALEGELARAAEALAAQAKELSKYKDRMAKLEGDRDNSNNEEAALQLALTTARATARAEQDRLQEEMAALSKEASDLKASHAAASALLEGQVNNLEAERAQLHATLDTKANEAAASDAKRQDRITGLEAEIQQLMTVQAEAARAHESAIQAFQGELTRMAVAQHQQEEQQLLSANEEGEAAAAVVATLRQEVAAAKAQHESDLQTAQSRITELEGQLTSTLEDVATQVAGAIEEKTERVVLLEKALQEAKATIDAHETQKGKKKGLLRARIQELEEELARKTTGAAESDIQRLTQALEESKAALQSVNEARAEESKEMNAWRTRVEELEAAVTRAGEQAATAEALSNRLNQELGDAKEAVEAAVAGHAEESKEKHALLARVEEVEALLRQAEEEAAKEANASEDLQRLHKELKEAHAALKVAEEANAESIQEKEALQVRIAELRHAAEEASTAATRAEADVKRLGTELQEAIASAASIAATKAEAQRLEEELRQTRDSHKERVRAMEEEARKHTLVWEAKLRETTARLGRLEQEKASWTEAMAAQSKEVVSLSAQLKEAKAAVGEATVAHETALFRMKRELEAVTEKGARVEAAESELERLREKRKKDMEEFKRLNAHLRDLQVERANEAEMLGVESAELRVASEQAHEELVGLRAAYERVQTSLREKEEELHALRQATGGQGQEQEETTRELRAALETLQAEMAQKTLQLEMQAQAQGNNTAKEEELAQAQELLAGNGKEITCLRTTIAGMEARMLEVDTLATASSEKHQQAVADLTRRLETAEAAREQAKQEAAKLREDMVSASSALQPSVVQRGGSSMKAAAAGTTKDQEEDLEAQQQLLEDEEARESFTAPLYRRYPVLARLHPAIDKALSQVRRRFPEQTMWVEANLFVHVNEQRVRLAYFVLLHMWLLYMLLF